MPKLFWDIETRSTVSLEDAGAWRYAADAMTEILCVAFAIEDHEPQIWTSSQPIPTEFFEVAGNPDWCVVAHNQQFERAITTHILQPRFGWPEIPLAQQRCSMALALAHALPGALENAAAALGLPFQKDREGYRLMRLMSRPRRPRKNEDPAGVYWIDGEELRARLQLYCKRDVETERAAFNRLPPLPPQEQQLWELDAVINARGFHVDIALAEAARDVARQEQIAVNA
jgi:DNA polymerase